MHAQLGWAHFFVSAMSISLAPERRTGRFVNAGRGQSDGLQEHSQRAMVAERHGRATRHYCVGFDVSAGGFAGGAAG
jgi:hypothetical protein